MSTTISRRITVQREPRRNERDLHTICTRRRDLWRRHRAAASCLCARGRLRPRPPRTSPRRSRRPRLSPSRSAAGRTRRSVIRAAGCSTTRARLRPSRRCCWPARSFTFSRWRACGRSRSSRGPWRCTRSRPVLCSSITGTRSWLSSPPRSAPSYAGAAPGPTTGSSRYGTSLGRGSPGCIRGLTGATGGRRRRRCWSPARLLRRRGGSPRTPCSGCRCLSRRWRSHRTARRPPRSCLPGPSPTRRRLSPR